MTPLTNMFVNGPSWKTYSEIRGNPQRTCEGFVIFWIDKGYPGEYGAWPRNSRPWMGLLLILDFFQDIFAGFGIGY